MSATVSFPTGISVKSFTPSRPVFIAELKPKMGRFSFLTASKPSANQTTASDTICTAREGMTLAKYVCKASLV